MDPGGEAAAVGALEVGEDHHLEFGVFRPLGGHSFEFKGEDF